MAETAKIDTGFFTLKEDVKNPKPDRRCSDRVHQPIWKKGWRIEVRESGRHRVKDTNEEIVFYTLYFSDNSRISADEPGYEEIMKVAEQAPMSVGQVHRTCNYGIDGLVAIGIETGMFTFEQFEQLVAKSKVMTDEELDALAERQWLSWVR